MTEFLARLKQRKLVQWALAYIAAAFALIQVIDVVAGSYHWPDHAMHIVFGLLALGFVVALVIAWYHGEKGRQRVSGPELLLIALVLAIGGGLLWRFGRPSATPVAVARTARSHNAAVCRSAPCARSSVEMQTLSPAEEGAGAARLSRASPAPTQAASAQPIPAKSVAVLPFENLSNDKNNEYFVAGMQGMILTKLGDIGELKVIARTSTADYASHPEDTKTIGRQLGVATLLEGSVQKSGNQVLIEVRLVNAGSGNQIWAQTYQRTLDNVFGVEGEVAQNVADALKAKLSPVEQQNVAAIPTTNRAAYNLFLRAQYQESQAKTNYDTGSMKAAIALYRQTVAQDPDFALAWAMLSRSESALAWFGGGGEDVKQLVAQARVDAERALKLQPDLAAARLALGFCEYWGRGDYAAALETFDSVLKLKPNDVDALEARGYVQRRLGHFDAAIDSLRQCMVLDPRNSSLAYELGTSYMLVSRYTDAEDAFQRALALDPENRNAKIGYSTSVLFESGDIPRALGAAQGDDPVLKLQRVRLLTWQRKYQSALALLDGIPDTPGNFQLNLKSKALYQADLYRLMGDMAQARRLYAEAISEHRAQLAMQRGINLAGVWQTIADGELGLGQTAEGMDAIGKAQAIIDESGDQIVGPAGMAVNAWLYAQADRPGLAVPLLAKALATPGIGRSYSPVLLWLDPMWDPIRRDPRFQALLKQYAQYKPAVIPVTSVPSSSSAKVTAQ